MNNIYLELYDPNQHIQLIKEYVLPDSSNTDTPLTIVKEAAKDRNRYPIAIMSKIDGLVGFFYLHRHEGPTQFNFEGERTILIRELSIDDRFKQSGFAAKALAQLNQFIVSKISKKIKTIIMVVNHNNFNAYHTYLTGGFEDTERRKKGEKGSLILMKKKI